MSWNYRVLRRVYLHPGGETEDTFGIYEVYYDEVGAPMSCSEPPIAVAGETVQELIDDFLSQAVALTKPVLEYSSFGSLDRGSAPRGAGDE